MPTAYYDSSLLTQRRQQQAVYSFKSNIAAVALSTNNPYVNMKLGGINADPSQELVADYKQGACVCNSDPNVYNAIGLTRNNTS